MINFLKNSEFLRNLLLSQNSGLTDEDILSKDSDTLSKLFSDTLADNSIFTALKATDIMYDDGKFISSADHFEYEDGEERELNITDILNDFLENDDVKAVIDADNDGELSLDEINNFIGVVGSLDENPEDISINDIFSTMQSISDGTFTNILPETAETAEVDTNNNVDNTSYPKNSGNVGDVYPIGDKTGDDNSTDINSLSLEELQSKKTEQESELKTAQNDVKSVYAGETEAIKAAQADCDTKKQAYEEALKNDENISDELKSRQQENQAAIDKEKDTISGLEADIYDKENKITEQKSVISSDESTISALASSISKLSSQKSDDEEVQADINSKLQAARAQLSAAKAKLEEDKATLQTLEDEKSALETDLSNENTTLDGLEADRTEIEAEIMANCGEETKLALEAFKAAEANIEEVKQSELTAAKAKVDEAQTKLDEINSVINAKNAKQIEKDYSVCDLGDPKRLYETLGLEEQGLSYEVFSKTIEGYSKLPEELRETGYLGIFDTTQSSDKERYYLLDLNNMELVGRTVLKTGSGDMSDVESANQLGSGATLSGFEQVKIGGEYYSSSMGKDAWRLVGLEDGINDNSEAKGTVVHFTKYEHTLGCKGFTPVYDSNGNVDVSATNAKMHKLFPEGAILFTYPSDEDYWDLSEYYEAA